MKRPFSKDALNVLVLLSLGVLSLGMPACDAVNTKNTPHDPFSLRTSYMELAGYTEGFAPGGTYDFNFTLRNRENTTWQDEYHVFLVDENGPVLPIADGQIDLAPDSGQSTVIKMTLPQGFKEGAYGFSVVVPDRGSTATTIHVGDDNGNFVKPWPEATAYP